MFWLQASLFSFYASLALYSPEGGRGVTGIRLSLWAAGAGAVYRRSGTEFARSASSGHKSLNIETRRDLALLDRRGFLC